MFGLNNFITAGKFFLVIAGELILIFVVVSFIIGLLMEYLPPARVRDYLSNKLTWVQYLLGAGLGALTPFCSCSTVPITAGLLKGGVPFGPTMAFLFSSPVLNPIIIALLLSLLGLKVTVFYVVVTFFGSIAMAATLSKLAMENQVKPLMNIGESCCTTGSNSGITTLKSQPLATACCSSGSAQPLTLITLPAVESSCCSANIEATASPDATFKDKLKNASIAAVDTFKGVFWYLLLGAGIGAFIYGFFPQDLVVRIAGPGNPWSIPIAAFIGVPMYIRAETVIPIAAALVGKGMGVGTVLALIIAGAGASIPEIIILSSMFKKKLIIAFVLNVFVIAIVAGYLVDILLY
ncbi:MAG: permease [Smithella sp.]|mgnify:CR=1 FL=1|nr:permease [Smithella sp.]MDM7987529.1 permease [Smithella sp.]HOU51544.1 permease [Smithella sp.]HQI73256.1 permease [Smithella sp.]